MNIRKHLTLIFSIFAVAACDTRESAPAGEHEPAEAHAQEVRKGPHHGRMLADGDFAIELAIFETGVPPEYHAWPTLAGKPLPPDQVRLAVTLTRLGDRKDSFEFAPQGDYLRGNGVVHEPHSFVVHVSAEYAGAVREWSFESFEGRTTIAGNIAEAAGIRTEIAGPAKLVETLTLYGRVIPDPAHHREISARYPGIIRAVHRNPGDRVKPGDALASIESDESLRTYELRAPIGGVVTARSANAGEQSGTGTLFTITDTSQVMVELAVFPRDRARVKSGAAVRVRATDSDHVAEGRVERLSLIAGADQSVPARVRIDNPQGVFVSGGFVTGEVAVAEREVPLAVKSSGLQSFRDFTVVYERVGETYEVRMLELGQQFGDWFEVLGGLESGAQYVTENSYVIKADIDKSGASHDH
jgi:cobalt-zinc-cadmium efflux system membrane fusion protein